MCPGKIMVQLNFMANLFQGPILLIWSMMSLDIVKAVNLQVGQAFAEGLIDMNIPQDVIGNRERWDWMHRAPETPETEVGYESHDRAAPGGAAAPNIAAPEIYFSLLEAQRGIIPNFFRYINCK